MDEREEDSNVMSTAERMAFLTQIIRGEEKTADKLKAVDLMNKLQSEESSSDIRKLEDLI